MASGRNLYPADVWVCVLVFTHLHIMHFANMILSLQTKLSQSNYCALKSNLSHRRYKWLVYDANLKDKIYKSRNQTTKYH